MQHRKPHYASYLLRLWVIERDAQTIWCASLENPMTGERHGFSTVERLFDFLRHHCEEALEPAQHPEPPEG